MNKKQKKVLRRIVLSLALISLITALFALEIVVAATYTWLLPAAS